MSNDSKTDANDKSAEKQPSRSEQNVEAKQRADVNSSVTGYTNQVKSQREEQKISGRSKATGAGADAHGKGGLASAKDLLGDMAHETLTKDTEKKTLSPQRKAELWAEIERDNYIVGKSTDKVLLAQANTDRTEIAKKPQKQETETERHNRIMKEHYEKGEQASNFAQRPGVRDAMTGSAAFAQSVKDLQECKWGPSIRIWRGHPTEITDYSAEYNLMELDSKDSARRQAEVFAHEAFHATHQDLDKLFGPKKLSKQDFVDTKMHQEAGAFLREITTNEELHHSRPTALHAGDDPNRNIEYVWVDKNNQRAEPQKQDMNALLVKEHGKIDQEKSLKRIEAFLRDHPAAIKDNSGGFAKDADGNFMMNDYVQHYGNSHEQYLRNYDSNRKALIERGYIK